MRERLIGLIQDSVDGCARHWAEVIADYLLENEVVVLPEKVYWFDMGGNITEAKRIDEFFAETEKGYGYQIAYSEIGKIVFLTREDAEAKLKGGE